MDRVTDLTLDFETYYDTQYSLKKMPTLEYVRDQRFKVHGVSVKVDYAAAEWITADDLPNFLERLGDRVNLICQNTYFDGLVLFTHFQWVPYCYSDTLSMARAILHHEPKHDLDHIAGILGLGGKLEGVLDKTKGVRDLPPDLWQELGGYANNDADKTHAVYHTLLPAFPSQELDLIDMTLRWGCCPTICVDVGRAERALDAVIEARSAKIEASGTTEEVLGSNPKFAAHLEELGLTPPTKTSPTTGETTYAFAKGDLEFQDFMADHPKHAALWAGRLAAKSTLEKTRIKRILNIGKDRFGTVPMPLKYYGAHTGRWSGTDGLNPQNFTRGSELRKSLVAPPGYVMLVADLKQIELRMNMWFCEQYDWLELLAQGQDVYQYTAAEYFNVPLEEVTEGQRFVGKTMELGLGYRMGWRKFQRTMALKDVYLNDAEAYRAVMLYRETHNKVKAAWEWLDGMLVRMYEGQEVEYKGVIFKKGAVVLPNGMIMDYPELEPQESPYGGTNWGYMSRKKFKWLHGGSFLENIIQALARIVMGEQMLEIRDTLDGVTIVSSTHDELLMLVREKWADQAKAATDAIMSTSRSWCPEVPLEVESGYAREYSK